jgi:DNA-binding response OmpR family regulator
VDDHDLVCEGIRRVLAVAGFVALTTPSDRTGVALFRQHASEIRAVLLDLRQPGESAGEDFNARRHSAQTSPSSS